MRLEKIEDKILNILQLKDNALLDRKHLDLILAGIDQKIELLRPYHFKELVNLKENVKYVKYLIPWILIVFFLAIVSPSLLSEPTERYIRHLRKYERPLSYKVVIVNSKFDVLKGDDFTIKIHVNGEDIPEILQLDINSSRIVYFEKSSPNEFLYTIRKVNNDFSFRVFNSEYESEDFKVFVQPKPIISDYRIIVEPPAYSRLKNRDYINQDNIEVLKGSNVSFEFSVLNTSNVFFIEADSVVSLSSRELNTVTVSRVVDHTEKYRVAVCNEFVALDDTLQVDIQVVEDSYPKIFVEQVFDSLNLDFNYFTGKIEDDFGFSKLIYNYRINGLGEFISESIDINRKLNPQLFYLSKEVQNYGLRKGDDFECYFEVYDNDLISGPKSSRSGSFLISFPNEEEIDSIVNSSNRNYKDELKNLLTEHLKAKEQIEELKNKILAEGIILSLIHI